MSTEIREIQLAQLTMLHEIDSICRKYEISYSLFAGSALGAVRHGGFIPWDDDLDVIMPRADYNRFMELAPLELNKEKYFFQKEFSAHWPMFFSKLRMNNTACIERYVPKDAKCHQGVYVDIFPADKLGDGKLLRGLQFLASKVVIAKSLFRRGYLTDSIGKKIFIQLCRLLPLKPFVKIARGEWLGSTEMLHSFFGASSKYKKSIYKREWITDTVMLKFEDNEFPVASQWDELLKTLYGDYMTPLPEEKRSCKVHGEIVDLNKSYTEYIDIQKKLVFSEYSRSIR